MVVKKSKSTQKQQQTNCKRCKQCGRLKGGTPTNVTQFSDINTDIMTNLRSYLTQDENNELSLVSKQFSEGRTRTNTLILNYKNIVYDLKTLFNGKNILMEKIKNRYFINEITHIEIKSTTASQIIEILKVINGKFPNLKSIIIPLYSYSKDLLEFLLDYPKLINLIQTANGVNPLIHAIHFFPEIAKQFIENGANLDLQDRNGSTALIDAISADQPVIFVKLLIEHDANLDSQYNINGWSALMFAIEKNQPEIAILLIENGANLDIQDNKGSTALMHAIKQEQPKIATLLIEYGANLDIQDKKGSTALMVAISRNKPKIAKLLLINGANLELTDDDGLSALDIAMKQGPKYNFIVDLIRKKQQKTKTIETEYIQNLDDNRSL